MKGFRGAALVLTLLAGGMPHAAAAEEISAEKFKERCDDGLIEIAEGTWVVGGHADLNLTCHIVMEPGTYLGFRDTDIYGGYGPGPENFGLVMADAPSNTKIWVIDSTIHMAGNVQLAPGCCFKGPFPGRDESNTSLMVQNSFISGENVELSASWGASGGGVLVRDSFLQATGFGDGGDYPFVVAATLSGGSGGSVQLIRNYVNIPRPGQSLFAATGTFGRTMANGNIFSTEGTPILTAGANGRCKSINNNPDVPCS